MKLRVAVRVLYGNNTFDSCPIFVQVNRHDLGLTRFSGLDFRQELASIVETPIGSAEGKLRRQEAVKAIAGVAIAVVLLDQ